MPAIITDKIKKNLVQNIFDQIQGTTPGDSDNYYYVGVGRSQQWQPSDNTDISPVPQNTEREERRMRYSLQSVKVVDNYSLVIPLHDWSANSVYSAFNDNVSGQPAVSYYVRTEDNNVYLCIRTGKNANGEVQVSQDKPDHTDLTLPIEDDGYVWKYMYTISTADANNFLTSEFMPMRYVDSAAPTDPYYGQYTVQNAAVDGQIVGYRVTEKGGVYTSAPSITVTGNGSGAQARAILNASGGIEAVEVGDSANAPLLSNMGSGYDYANVVVSGTSLSVGGTAAKVVPIFGPAGGLGNDAREDFRCTSIMFNVKPEGTVEDTWIVGNDYRQVGIMKNITEYDSAAAFTETQGTALRKIRLTTNPGDGTISYSSDVEITGASSTAKAWLDFYDDSETLWYHQDEETGFTPFQAGEEVTVEGYNASTLTISSLIDPDIDAFSGQLIYIDNRATSTTRSAEGSEDIKVVIKL